MPGWYEHIGDRIENGQLQAVGIVQEQHPDRTLLFNQWKQLTMDLLADPLNALDVSGVPIVLLVDESGTIRYRNPRPPQLDEFLQTDYSAAVRVPEVDVPGSAWAMGDQMLLSGRLEDSIQFYRDALGQHAQDARLLFRLGVALRMRYDSPDGNERDFGDAVRAWTEARRINPNQYIWRRRIQQYGPVLDKPYPFYHWVEQARREIQQRGEQPLPLTIEPTGAELAAPARVAQGPTGVAEPPDPDGKLHRDQGQMVHIQSLMIRSTEPDQRAARVHLVLAPAVDAGLAWNNEAEPLQVWIDAHTKLQVAHRLLEHANPDAATSEERRALEFEVTWPIDVDVDQESLRGYAVYNVCDKTTGACMIRRQDIVIRCRPGG